jgi:acyl-CoA thioester hydrolase
MTLPYLTPLTPSQQLDFGLEKAQPMAMADKVRYSEIDVLNHVNNKAYMGWFESLRVAHFDQLCAQHFADMPAPRTVLRNANVHYIKEMLMDEDYITTMRVTGFRTTSYTIQQQIWSGDLRCTLDGVMVLRSPDGAAGYPIPESLCQQFIELDGARPAN